MRCARTSAHLGTWSLKRQDQHGNIYSNCRFEHEDEEPDVERWQDLVPVPHDDPRFADYTLVADQEELPVDILSHLKVGQYPLGAGSFGVAYKASLRLPHRHLKNYVAKISKLYLDYGAYEINQGLIRRTNAFFNVSAGEKAHAVANLRTEMENFEKIYEPEDLHQRFAGGLRGENISMSELENLQDRDAELDQHDGREYIHVYKYLDIGVPMLLTEACDGSLYNLRAQNKDWFMASGADALSITWHMLAEQLATGVDYIRMRGMVHCDLKLENILYKITEPQYPGQPLHERIKCQISDFGICRDHASFITGRPPGTRYYLPSKWPAATAMEAGLVMVFSLMAALAELLAVPVIAWPRTVEAVHAYGNTLAEDVYALHSSRSASTRQFADEYFPDPQPADYEQRCPSWWAVAGVMFYDFRQPMPYSIEPTVDYVMRDSGAIVFQHMTAVMPQASPATPPRTPPAMMMMMPDDTMMMQFGAPVSGPMPLFDVDGMQQADMDAADSFLDLNDPVFTQNAARTKS